MILSERLLTELQRRLKIGNRRGVHLNAIPARSRYKIDVHHLSCIKKNIPAEFVEKLLSEINLTFPISLHQNFPEINELLIEEQQMNTKVSKAFENLINQTDAIESEKGMNTFGFGFPLLIRRDLNDNQLTVAPILIWSLRIKRRREVNQWEIQRNKDDAVYINEVLINHLIGDAGIVIDQIPPELLENGLIDRSNLLEVCSRVIRATNPLTTDEILDQYNRDIDNISPIKSKEQYAILVKNPTTTIIDFAGLFSIFEVQKQNIINDYKNLVGKELETNDLEGHSFQSISGVQTDPSQQSILQSLGTNRNLLIQGPPGTGKSQTLTAVLINALENKKTTLVVCEKRTALEVLEKALKEKGFGDLSVLIKDIIKDRKIAVDSVRRRAEIVHDVHNEVQSQQSLGIAVTKVSTLINSINKQHEKLSHPLLGNKKWTNIVGNLLSEVKVNGNNSGLNIDRNIFDFSPQNSLEEFTKYQDLAQKGQKLYADYLPFKSRGILNPKKITGDNLYLIEQNIKDEFKEYSNQLNQIKEILDSIKLEYRDYRNTEFQKQLSTINSCIQKVLYKETELGKLVFSAKSDYLHSRNTEFNEQLSDFQKITDKIDSIINNNRRNIADINENEVKGLKNKIVSIFSKEKKNTIRIYRELKGSLSTLRDCLKQSKDFQHIVFDDTFEGMENSLTVVRRMVSSVKIEFNNKIEKEFAEFQLSTILHSNSNESTLRNLQRAINYPLNSKKHAETLQTIKSKILNYIEGVNTAFSTLQIELSQSRDIKLSYSFGNSYTINKSLISEINTALGTIKSKINARINEEFIQLNLIKTNLSLAALNSHSLFKDKIVTLAQKIESDSWTSTRIQVKDHNQFISDVELLLRVQEEYFEGSEDLFILECNWYQFYNALTRTEQSVIKELMSKNDWASAFRMFYLQSILSVYSSSELPINDKEHLDLVKAMSEIENKQKCFVLDFWNKKQIQAIEKFSRKNLNLTIINLYNQRSSHRFKRHTLREIIKYDTNLFTTFFPIVLTTPDIASNLFHGMNGYFDIVMFDEASQLRLEDNLPAVLKGKQVIIAGDEHQMPPSNYFNQVFDGAIEDEDDADEEDQVRLHIDDVLLSCESLLDLGIEMSFQKKYLDFHYRSKHHFLIDFSNYAFYNQRLLPLPNNFDYTPIKYIQTHGTFSGHTNEREADMVLSILENNINRLPDGKFPSVGIATFNISQRDLITSKIIQRRSNNYYSEFNDKIAELEENGLFIKNLENIQGDERDVIILSTTYGKNPGGVFAQRFGPLNHSKGYKLLNVIITRAKNKVYCCTSIPEQVFMRYNEYLITEGSNNRRGVFYAYLAYCKAVSENDIRQRLSILESLANNSTVNPNQNIDNLNVNLLESPFEEEVYERLLQHFSQDQLLPQYKFAGFRIDIVYDPKIAGAPKIAIECDGAKYHSSREAYLHDIYRQRILEDHGFVFHRIWSTNWWRNANREVEKLVQFIKDKETTQILATDTVNNPSTAFTDDIVDRVQNTIFDEFTEHQIIQIVE